MFQQLGTWNPGDTLMPIQEPQDARQAAVRRGASLTIVKGTAIGIKTADKLAYAYNNALSDGTEVCVGIAMYSFKTDANGNVYYSDSAVISEFNSAHLTSPIWKTGIFDPTTLTGFDAAAKVDMFGRTLQNGFVQIG
jgi:hypothetical protein